MKKIILRDEEYEILKKVLEAVPPADLYKLLPEATGADQYWYRGVLTKVLQKDCHFPDAD